MALPIDYRRLGGPRALPRAERRRATAIHIGKVSRAAYEANWLAARAEADTLRAERDEQSGRADGWRGDCLAVARDLRRMYLAALLGWGLALLFAAIALVPLVVRLVVAVARVATGG